MFSKELICALILSIICEVKDRKKTKSIMYQYYLNTVTFAEKPASNDEMAIAEVIKNLHEARKKRSVEQIVSFYDENAIIRRLNSDINGTRKEFEERLRSKIKNLHSTYFGDISIRLTNDFRAVVAVTACYHYTTYTIGPTRLIFVMEKKNNEWRIMESEGI